MAMAAVRARMGLRNPVSPTSSLISPGDSDRESRDDDEARLTGNMSAMGTSESWPEDSSTDAERAGGYRHGRDGGHCGTMRRRHH
jgi:hypothetical protein